MSTQWERTVDHLRIVVDGLGADELEVLGLFQAARLRIVRGQPDQVVDTAGLGSLACIEAERMNAQGLQHYRRGHPDFAAFASIATPADVARRDTDFQRLLGAVVNRQPPHKGQMK